MKKLLSALFGLFLLALTATADSTAAAKGLTGKLHLSDCIPGGETAIRNVVLELAAANPELEIVIEKTDPVEALKRLAVGETDLVLTAEPVVPTDLDGKVEVRRYAAVAALIFVNADNPKREFSATELQAVFSGALGSWSSLNGNDYTLHRLALQAGKPAELLFRGKIMQDKEYTEEIYRKPDSAQLLILAAGNPHAIVLAGYPGPEIDANLLAVAVDGVPPTLENLKNGKYPLQYFRVMLLPETQTAAVTEFLKRVNSVAFRNSLGTEELFAL